MDLVRYIEKRNTKGRRSAKEIKNDTGRLDNNSDRTRSEYYRGGSYIKGKAYLRVGISGIGRYDFLNIYLQSDNTEMRYLAVADSQHIHPYHSKRPTETKRSLYIHFRDHDQ